MSKPFFDAVIIGAGPIGGSLALGFAQLGLKTALVDARDPSEPLKLDGRNYAVVTGSWTLLASLGLEEALRGASEPLKGLEAIDGGSHWFGRPSALFTDMDLEAALPDQPLGYMVQAEALQSAIDDAIASCPDLTVMSGVKFKNLTVEPAKVLITLEDGAELGARLLIGADGMSSAVRQAHGLQVEGRDYKKSVFTANVRLAEPHQGIARQFFMPEGPFATLPLPGQRANLAWYMQRGAAEALVKAGSEAAELELNARFADLAGEMQIEGQIGAYPLILQVATEIVADRTVLVGDAARRVNPLAGQGLNQGFRDVAALLECVEDTVRIGGDIGSSLMLEQFSRARRFDGLGTALALDGLDRLFSNDSLLTKPVRSLGLFAASRLSPVRRFLARKASASENGVPRRMQDW